MEGFGGFNSLTLQTLEGNVNQRANEDEVPTNEMFEVGSSDEQEMHHRGDAPSGSRTVQYNRYTPYQIQELDNFFKEDPHPNERQRLAIAKKLNIDAKKVKFWFQNKRTQLKTQTERHDNAILKQENDKLKIENMALKETIRHALCNTCGGQANIANRSVDEQKVLIENAQLREELNHSMSLVQTLLGKPLSSTLASTSAQGITHPNDHIEKDEIIGGMNFGAINQVKRGLQTNDDYLELASKAMEELMKLGKVNAPLWRQNIESGGESLNFKDYERAFPSLLGTKPFGFASEASKANAVVSMSSQALVGALLDANRWRDMFVGMIGSSTIMKVISSGTGGTRNNVLQLMKAEIQLISPLVPVREIKFLRFSKQHAKGVWAVVDLSVDAGPDKFVTRRCPSGCILHDMPNGFSKVTWIEHTEYDEYLVNHQYRWLLSSGLGFGAQKWICALLRHCDCLRAIMSPTAHQNLLPSTKVNVKSLTQRMTSQFCAGVCLTRGQQWGLVDNAPRPTRIMTRRSINNPGEPSGIIVSVTTSVWIAATHQHLFDLLLNKDLRCVWDILCHGKATENVINFPMGQDETSPNRISILCSNTSAKESPIMILQETSSDMTGSLIVYASVDISTVSQVMKGGDTSCVALMPSGLYIVPGYGGERGSMATLGFQILIQDTAMSSVTTETTIKTVNDLVSRTIQGIKEIVRSSQQGE